MPEIEKVAIVRSGTIGSGIALQAGSADQGRPSRVRLDRRHGLIQP